MCFLSAGTDLLNGETMLMGADNHTSSDILLGDILIVCAQVYIFKKFASQGSML
jgi:hypothetical protein